MVSLYEITYVVTHTQTSLLYKDTFIIPAWEVVGEEDSY